jgi:hypothetical protein
MLAIKTLDFIKECIINGDCSDEELQENMSRMGISSVNGRINKNNYVNVEQAMAIIGTKNRHKFFDIVHKYGLVNHKFNNQHIGYIKEEVIKVASTIKQKQFN